MVFPVIILFLCVLFCLQLVFCFKAERRWIRCGLLFMTALGDLACWILYAAGGFSEIFGAAFAFYIYGMVLTLALGAELLAWILYAVVKYIQKRRK